MRKKLGRNTGLVRAEAPPAPPGEVLLDRTFPSTPEAKSAALDELVRSLSEAGAAANESETVSLRLCLDEALVNACMHGNRYDAAKSVRVRAAHDKRAWTVLVEDQGAGFREEDLPDPDDPENLLEEGGRGVLLIREYMDEVAYFSGGAALRMTRLRKRAKGKRREIKSASASRRMRAVAHDVPLERRVVDLESILSLTRAIAAESDLTRLLHLLAASCRKVLQVERTSIWVIDPETGELFTRVAEQTGTLRVPAGKGIVGAVAEAGEPLLIPDAYADPRFNPDVDKKSGFRTREILNVPLFSAESDRVVGVLQALNRVEGKLGAYDLELAGLIAAQVGVVLEQAALREQAEERKRLQAEMDLARGIQQSLLPEQAPDVAGLEIAGANRSAAETSGDAFDYVDLGEGRTGVIVADVTGHGLGAALIMTAARAYLRALCEAHGDPAKVLAAANALLSRDLKDGNFLSLCLAVFDPEKGEIRFASAGHDPPLVYRPSEDVFAELDSTGPLLGVLPEADFEVIGPLPAQPGDVMVFMTDGLFECMDAGEETFGKVRVQETVRATARKSAGEILDALLAAADRWTGGRPPRDDITLVVVKIGPDFGARG